MRIRETLWAWRRNLRVWGMKRYLIGVSPERIAGIGEERLVRAFQHASRRVPAYRQLLRRQGLDPSRIQTADQVRRFVPILDKKSIFSDGSLASLCLDGEFSEVRSVTVSSGSSGNYAFGSATRRNEEEAVKATDDALALLFDTGRRRTLLVNVLPMGVSAPTRLPYAATGTRADAVATLLEKCRDQFEQFILVGDPHFLKKIVDDGIAAGMDWQRYRIHMISGGDWLAEELRTYLSKKLGHDFEHPERGMIGVSMGITELGLNIFHETIDLIRLRRAINRDPKLRAALCGAKVRVTPMLFHYDPHRIYPETPTSDADGWGDLVCSNLAPDSTIPLLRYNTGDVGKLISFRTLERTLTELGYASLIPRWRLPLVLMRGRSGRGIRIGRRLVTPEEIRAGLFASRRVAAATNGQFTAFADSNKLTICITLYKNTKADPALTETAERALKASTGVPVCVDWRPVVRVPGMVVDYQRKFTPFDGAVANQVEEVSDAEPKRAVEA